MTAPRVHAAHPLTNRVHEPGTRSVRPDFGVLIDERFSGWAELKAPGTGTDARSWAGRNRRQWGYLAELDNLLLSDGEHVQLFREGQPDGAAVSLPYGDGAWSRQPLIALLRRFKSAHPRPIRTARDLAHALAPLARDLRLRIRSSLEPGTVSPPVKRAQAIWSDLLHDDISDDQFADALAQVVAYSLVIATLDGTGDLDGDGLVTLEEAGASLDQSHRVLAATLRPALEVQGLRDVLRSEVGALERLLGAVDAQAIERRKDPRGDPWLWFYEDFLEAYDPEARRNAGVYYTPVPVVECITGLVEHVLTEQFGLRLAFADERVVILDPATGTGTFPLSVIDRAAARAKRERGAAGPQQIANGLAARLFGFELLPGPFAVAHLRVGRRLQELGAVLPPGGAQVMLADTLDTPTEDPSAPQLALFGAAEVLSEERRRVRRIKREQQVMAIVANPPYDRVSRENAGGWVVHGDSTGGSVLFDDVLATANEHTIFSHVASLYNLYAYFWRWAIWKAFEHHGDGPAVIGFITASSWLDAPGFVGLRELVRDVCDEVWIVDLGGDNRGARPEENVFAIESPVAIAILIRRAATDRDTPARLMYRRISGSRVEKLSRVSDVEPPTPDDDAWTELVSERWTLFTPETGDAAWLAMPAVGDLFPWQQPGCKLNRTWPVAPGKGTLDERWRAFLQDTDPARRSALFPNPTSGRTVTTKVGDLPRLADLPANAPPLAIEPYGWKPFDRQWTFKDPRLAKTESPALWQSVGPHQVFLIFPSAGIAPGPGPTVHATTAVPDMNSFKGSASGSIIALFRDANGTIPNVTAGLLETIGDRMRQSSGDVATPTPEDLAAYAYALLSTPEYQARFAEPLTDKVVRLPLTAEPDIWARAVALGRELLWLHTFAARYRDVDAGLSDRVPDIDGLGWTKAVSAIPDEPADIAYDEQTQELRVGDGVIAGVRPSVWALSVSGWPVVRRWLENRTRRGRGRYGSPLDNIRPSRWLDAWNDELLDLLRVLTRTLELRVDQDEILSGVCAGGLISAYELPTPDAPARAVPATQVRTTEQPTQLSDQLGSAG